jgi:hypothetical protein
VPDNTRIQNNRLDFIDLVNTEDDEHEDHKEDDQKERHKRDLTNTTHYVPKPPAPHENNTDFQSYKRLCKGLDVKVCTRIIM